MPTDPNTVEELMDRASRGDHVARDELLGRFRDRLRLMVNLRMDRQLAARVDPSDIVQDALADAVRHFSDYVRTRPMPFYPWLRRLAWKRLVDMHRRHVRAERRSIKLEERWDLRISDESAESLGSRLVSSATEPSDRLIRSEMLGRVRSAMARLGDADREILVLRYLEELSTAETAVVLEISTGAVKSRLMRALMRMRDALDDKSSE
jgi:RNA polymerase sigma-70 factor (ECF subfamily)